MNLLKCRLLCIMIASFLLMGCKTSEVMTFSAIKDKGLSFQGTYKQFPAIQNSTIQQKISSELSIQVLNKNYYSKETNTYFPILRFSRTKIKNTNENKVTSQTIEAVISKIPNTSYYLASILSADGKIKGYPFVILRMQANKLSVWAFQILPPEAWPSNINLFSNGYPTSDMKRFLSLKLNELLKNPNKHTYIFNKTSSRQTVNIRPLEDPKGWYVVTNASITQVGKTDKIAKDFRFNTYLDTASDAVRDLNRGDKVENAVWNSRTRLWTSQSYLKAVAKACGRAVYSPRTQTKLMPVLSKETGQQLRGVYRFQSLSNQPRICKLGSYNARTCQLTKCLKWSDHPDYAHQTSFLIKNKRNAQKTFQNLEQFTYDKQGLGSVQRPKQRSNNKGWSASEDARQSTYDLMTDWWID